jgi:hypothetical protein
MAISGSLNYEGLEITGSYTNIKTLSYTNNNGYKTISFEYQLFVDEAHREGSSSPFLSKRTQFSMSPSGSNTENLLEFAYNCIKNEPYFSSSSFIDC